MLAEAARKAGAEVWAYCLMPNHVHIIIVPSDEDRLRRAFADAHRRYTGYMNARMRVTGHLWQSRFGSVVMDEEHLMHAVRYISLNPVRAKLVERAKDWPWSSVVAHLSRKDDGVRQSESGIGTLRSFFDVFLDKKRVSPTNVCDSQRQQVARWGAKHG